MQLIYRGTVYNYTPTERKPLDSKTEYREVELSYRGIVYRCRRPVVPAYAPPRAINWRFQTIRPNEGTHVRTQTNI